MTKFFLLFLSLFLVNLNAQTDSTYTDQTEIFVIDSYITPETPHKFIVSFSTSDSCTSIIQLKGMKTYVVSNSFTDNHKFEMDLSEIQYDSTAIKYRIYTKNREGLDTKGEEYEVELPREIVLSASNEINWYQMCIGGLVFAIPTLEYVQMNGGEHLGLSKEIPLYNFYSQGYNYPQGYIGIEYSHYVDAARKNFLRLGYKHMFQF